MIKLKKMPELPTFSLTIAFRKPESCNAKQCHS